MSDNVRERFDKFRDEYYNTHCMDAGQAISFEAGYQAAQAEAAALVDELVRALEMSWSEMYVSGIENERISREALTKAQAWRESCK